METLINEIREHTIEITAIAAIISGVVSVVMGIVTFRRVKREESHREEGLRNQKESNLLQQKHNERLDKLIESHRQEGLRSQEESNLLQQKHAETLAKLTHDTPLVLMELFTQQFEQLRKTIEVRFQEQENHYRETLQKVIEQFNEAEARQKAQQALLNVQAEELKTKIDRSQQSLANIQRAEQDLDSGKDLNESFLSELGLGEILGAFASATSVFGRLFGGDYENEKRLQLREYLAQQGIEIANNLKGFQSQLQQVAPPTATLLTLKPGAKVKAKWKGGSFFPGKIAEVEGDKIFVHYDDGDKEWTTPDMIELVG